MMEQKLRRLNGFRTGVWVRMGDGQKWMFPHPPVVGTDREYDGLIRCLLEAEDFDEARRIELALGILLFSRNYDPQPCDYESIFSFDDDRATQSAAEAAISALIYEDLEERRVPRHAVESGSRSRPRFFARFTRFALHPPRGPARCSSLRFLSRSTSAG